MSGDRFDRWGWLGNMAFNVSVSHYTYHQGNYNGNLDFVFLPDNSSERTIGTVSRIHKMLPVYATCVCKCVLREMSRFLCDDSSAAENQILSAVEERLLKILLYDDVNIVYDMRCQNGNPDCTRFYVFWSEMER